MSWSRTFAPASHPVRQSCDRRNRVTGYDGAAVCQAFACFESEVNRLGRQANSLAIRGSYCRDFGEFRENAGESMPGGLEGILIDRLHHVRQRSGGFESGANLVKGYRGDHHDRRVG